MICRCIPVILTLGRPRQENHQEFKASLGYTALEGDTVQKMFDHWSFTQGLRVEKRKTHKMNRLLGIEVYTPVIPHLRQGGRGISSSRPTWAPGDYLKNKPKIKKVNK